MDASNAEVRSLLGDLLAVCGVTYSGARRSVPSPRRRNGKRAAPEIDLTALERPARTFALPALLGGEPAFEHLPFARPTRPPLDDVTKLFESSYDAGMLTNGPLVGKLEERLAERLGVNEVVAVNTCTSGLMLVLRAVVDGRSGPVVLPSFTFSASAHVVAWNGRTPEFVECMPDTLQIDVAHAANSIDGASAVLATHVFGAPCNPEGVVAVARARGIPVVFDAAHAMGSQRAGTPVGGFGAAEVFSLTPTKPLVAGEGGIVATNDPAIADAVRVGRDYGNPGDYDTRFAGLSARMSEFHAATALLSLDMLDESLARRNEIALRYQSALAGIPGIRFQSVDPDDFSTYKDFVILVDPGEFGVTRDLLAVALRWDGIDTRNYFDPPVHRQQSYAHVDRVHLPVTDDVARRVIALPMFTALDDAEIDRIADVIGSVHAHADAINDWRDRHLRASVGGVRRGRSANVTRP